VLITLGLGVGKPFGRGYENGAAETIVERHEKPISEVEATLENIMTYGELIVRLIKANETTIGKF
jgi:hypothetical protein